MSIIVGNRDIINEIPIIPPTFAPSSGSSPLGVKRNPQIAKNITIPINTDQSVPIIFTFKN